MTPEAQIAEEWPAMRAVEIDEARKCDRSLMGRPSARQQLIIDIIDREMTSGDVQTQLRVRHGISLEGNQLSSAMKCLKNAARIREVGRVMGMVIWGPVT